MKMFEIFNLHTKLTTNPKDTKIMDIQVSEKHPKIIKFAFIYFRNRKYLTFLGLLMCLTLYLCFMKFTYYVVNYPDELKKMIEIYFSIEFFCQCLMEFQIAITIVYLALMVVYLLLMFLSYYGILHVSPQVFYFNNWLYNYIYIRY